MSLRHVRVTVSHSTPNGFRSIGKTLAETDLLRRVPTAVLAWERLSVEFHSCASVLLEDLMRCQWR